jgi:hypothetical protein
MYSDKYVRFFYKYRKRISFFIGFLLVAIGILLNYTYRKYIYKFDINDFHIADTIGSWLCVPAGTMIFFAIDWKKSSLYKIFMQVIVANLAYELLSLFEWHGVFDLYDIAAIIAGAVLTFFIIRYLKLLVKKVIYNGI